MKKTNTKPSRNRSRHNVPPYAALDSKKTPRSCRTSARLLPEPYRPRHGHALHPPNQMYFANPKADTESLLANASESLSSATVMLGDFAALLEGSHRKTLLGIAQVVMLGELAVNQALDNVEPGE